MTTTQGREYDALLSRRTEQLIWEHRHVLDDREVLNAVTRAGIHVRDSYTELGLDPPPPAEYVAMVIELAMQELAPKLPAAPETTGAVKG